MSNQIKEGEVWFVDFPFEDNPQLSKKRPVVVLNVDNGQCEVLATKITTQGERDTYDTKIIYWSEAGLRFESVARTSKTIIIPMARFEYKIGDMVKSDLDKIEALFMKYVNEFNNA